MSNPDENERRIDEALRVASDYAMTDGEHHKQWVLDQMVRYLTGCQLVREEGRSPDEPPRMVLGRSDEYVAFLNGEEWDEGIAP